MTVTRSVPSSYTRDNCAICLEPCVGYPEGDTRYPKVVLKTECNHYFHELCMQKLLAMGVNDNCPLCREPLDPKRFTIVKLADQQKPLPKPPAKVPVDRPRIRDTVFTQPKPAPAPRYIETQKPTEGPTLFDFGWGAARYIGGSIFSAARDFVWPTEIDPRSVQIINREVDRLHQEINDKVRKQQDTMKVLLGQVASIGQDRSRNPVAILNEVKNFYAKLEVQAEKYLKETEATIRKMEAISSRF